MLFLISTVEEHLPLGTNEWVPVVDAFNAEASKNGRPKQELEPLKNKFKTLASSTKPTGDPTCNEEIRQAKRVEELIITRAAQCAYSEMDSDEDEGNGVGADVELSDEEVAMSPHRDAGVEDPEESMDTVFSGWSETQSTNTPAQMSSRDARSFRLDSPQSTQTPSISSQTPLQARPLPISSTNRQSKGRPGNPLGGSLSNFLDLNAQQEHDREQTLSAFFSAQVIDAHATIHKLQAEVARLQGGVQSKLLRVQEEKHRPENENVSLKSEIKILQLRIDMQPNPMYHHPYQGFGEPPHQPTLGYPQQTPSGYPHQTPGGYPQQTTGGYPQGSTGAYPHQPMNDFPQQPMTGNSHHASHQASASELQVDVDIMGIPGHGQPRTNPVAP
ncbi:hypothetical protein MJO28_013927 [Puccinia striiformis f. sp. tritici]|uniref:Uncharacterized protein n=1 Tax=Puccinia striiformis f. sp. tritici TaxID=168172 RepID=A0ACC0DWC5_9BASI|nr:hypothetical protein MJO28_013927 [Puccinia striiformis f. sp. tritici]